MRFNTSIALAAMAVVLAMPGAAEAKAKHHHSDQAEAGLSSAEQLQIAQEEISQLQAQLNALQSKIDAVSAGQVAAAQGTPATQAVAAQAAAASQKADTALAVATAAQATASSTAKATDWAAGTKVGGQVFFNASNVFVESNGVRNGNSGAGVNVKRIYLTVDHTFNKVFSANVTLDAANVVGNTSFYANQNGQNSTPGTAGGASNTVSGKTAYSSQGVVGKGLFVKYAYLQAKLNPALTIRVGAAPTAWIPYIDSITGTRYIDQGLTERDKFGNSADWGVSALGDLFGGHVSYQFGVVDGAGYRKLYVTKYVDVDGRVSAQYDGFFAALGGYVGHEGLVNSSASANATVPYHTYSRGDAAVGFKNDRFTLGGEYLYARNLNTVTSAPSGGAPVDDRSNAFSVFGKVVVTPKVALLGRYDWVKYEPNRLVATATRDHFFFGGIQYEPYKFVDLTLLYKRELVNDNAGFALGTNDGTFAASAHTTYDEVGLFSQFKF